MYNTIFAYKTSNVVIARYNENIEWTNKFNKFKNYYIYEKEKPDKDPFNVPINKGNEASAYLKYIIDNYNNLSNHIVFIHCHETSWHHLGSIVDIIDSYIGNNIEIVNLNHSNCVMGNDQKWLESDLGYYIKNLIEPAVGAYIINYNFTYNEKGCAQFIIHKSRILHHSLKFYQDIYDWIFNSNVDGKKTGYFLEWTWNLFWNKWLINTPIILYKKEKILFVFQLDNKQKYINNITNNVIEELKKNNYFKVTNSVKIIILSENIIIKELIATNYIFNKYK